MSDDFRPAEPPELDNTQPAEEDSSAAVPLTTPPRRSRTSAAAERLRDLNETLSESPDCTSAFILRGELLLDLGDVEAAEEDLQRALTLAEQELQTSAWGLIAQELRDRALRGLARITRGEKSKENW